MKYVLLIAKYIQNIFIINREHHSLFYLIKITKKRE